MIMDKIVDIATVSDYNAYWGVGRKIKKIKRMWQKFRHILFNCMVTATKVSK